VAQAGDEAGLLLADAAWRYGVENRIS